MDCTLFEWEACPTRQPAISSERSADSRARLGCHLRLVYTVAADDQFRDLIRKFDAPTNDH